MSRAKYTCIKITRNNVYIVVNKQELFDLRNQINTFMRDFKKPNLDWEDNDKF